MSHIPENPNTEITPIDFEKLIHDYLSNIGKDLKSFSSKHNQIIQKPDGSYQIDIYAEFEELGGIFKVLVECKKHINPIKREVAQILYDKLRATGSQKGMIFSTSGFQSGAIKYAKEHGIALIKVYNGELNYLTKGNPSNPSKPPNWADIQKYQGEFTFNGSINYLQIGHLDAIHDFLFETNFNDL